VNVYNPLHHGDLLSVGGVTSGERMAYARLAYEAVMSGEGTRAGAAVSALHYRLGDVLAPLDASGNAAIGSLWLTHPIVRSRGFNLNAQLQYDRQQLRDRVGASDIANDRHLDQGTLGVSGDVGDAGLSPAVNGFSLSWTSGRLAFDDDKARFSDAATAGTQGAFSKWNLSLNRLQRLGDRTSVYIAFAGQWTAKNLDSSQKMVVGGPASVRAYDTGAVAGDVGQQVTVELRQEVGSVLNGSLQAIAFVDGAHVTIDQRPWAAGTNGATLSGAGVGLRWAGPDHWTFSAFVATPTGAEPALASVTRKTRAWVEVGRLF
jgi:hemolysin activation/secretion protein